MVNIADFRDESACDCDHANPLCDCHVSDADRADLLEEYLTWFAAEFGERPLLMPVGHDKRPIIEGRCSLDSDSGRGYLTEPGEAIRQIRENGHPGYVIYAGKPDHRTDDVAFVEVDCPIAYDFETLPPTLMVLSGSGVGPHLTFRNAGDVRNATIKGEPVTEGESEIGSIRASNHYVVAPGTIHPSGGIYHVIGDGPVAEIADDDLPEHMTPVADVDGSGPSPDGDLPEPTFTVDDEIEEGTRFESELGVDLDTLRDRIPALDAALEGADEQDRSGADWFVAATLWEHRFTKADIAQIIRLHRPYHKTTTRRGDYLLPTVEKVARKVDRIDPSADDDADGVSMADHAVLPARRQYPFIDDADFPTEFDFTLDKPARGGGSHWTMAGVANADRSYVYLGHRHSSLRQQLETADETMPEGWTAVHLEGKDRACDQCGDGGVCSAYPMDFQTIQEWEIEVRNIVARGRTITADDAPVGLCPAWFVKHAAKHADVVFTVPQLIDRNYLPPGKFDHLIVDEAQTLDPLRPPSASLIEIAHATEPDGTTGVRIVDAPIVKHAKHLDAIRDKLEAENADLDRVVAWRKAAISALDYLDGVLDALGVSNAEAETRSGSLVDVRDELLEGLAAIDQVDRHDADPDTLREKVTDLCADFMWDDDSDPASLLLSVLFPADNGYDDPPFYAKTTGTGSVKIWHVGGRQLFHRDWLDAFDRINLVGMGPEGERFLSDLGRADDALYIDITEFRYRDRFAIMTLGRDRDDGRLEPVADQRDRVARVARQLNEHKHSAIAVTGTQDAAYTFCQTLTNEAGVISNPTSPAKDMYAIWDSGGTVVIYENSAVTRGIDAPQFDVTCVVSSGFAAPYWEWLIDTLREKDFAEDPDARDRYLEAIAVEHDLKARELTNAAFRMSPSRAVEDSGGTKLIVCAADDADKIRYLDDRRLGPHGTAEYVTNRIRTLTTTGGYERASDRLYRGLGGSEKAFIEVTRDEGIHPDLPDRPRYEWDQLESWAGDDRFPNPDMVDHVRRVVRDNEPVMSSDMYDLCRPNDISVKIAIEVLERKGEIERVEQPNGKRGPNPTVLRTVTE